MVRGSSSPPVAVRACGLLLSPDANTVKGEAILCEKKFLIACILFEPQSLCYEGRTTCVIVWTEGSWLMDGLW